MFDANEMRYVRNYSYPNLIGTDLEWVMCMFWKNVHGSPHLMDLQEFGFRRRYSNLLHKWNLFTALPGEKDKTN